MVENFLFDTQSGSQSELILMFASSAGRLLYSKELTAGPQLLRPFHLSWRADFGLSAFIEPDNLVEIVELILLNGLLSSLKLKVFSFKEVAWIACQAHHRYAI